MGTLQVKADTANNRLNVKMTGYSADSEMVEQVRRVVAELPKLRPGWVMVSDISEMKPTTPSGTAALEKAMKAYKQNGIARIVRIVGADVIGKMQMQRLAKEAGIQIDYVTSTAEAEALLKAK
jgi:hypothetical protein